MIYFDFREKTKKSKNRFFGFFAKIKIKHYKKHFFWISGWPIPTYFLTRNPNLTLFFKKSGPLRGQNHVFYRKPFFENWVSNKKSIFNPLGVNLSLKIRSDSDFSSKNTSVWVKPKSEKMFFEVIYFDFYEKNKRSIFSFFSFFTKIKINHYKNQLFGFWFDPYRRMFWRGIRIWPYF